ncbi:transporter [Bacillus gobiensis]|uniref:transporter n=1 Tax=Bacillus gobiensis TaxID=1441095 RepID=UPI003D1ABAC1
MFPFYPYEFDTYRQQFPGSPPPGFGGQGQQFPGSPPPGFGGQGQYTPGPPSGPPPSYIPQQQQGGPSVYAVDPGGIRGCLFRYTYIRLENGARFWYFPTFVGRRSVAGYRWRPRQFRWVYFGIDLDEITSFSC